MRGEKIITNDKPTYLKRVIYPIDIINSKPLDILVYTYFSLRKPELDDIMEVTLENIRKFCHVSTNRNGKIIDLRNSINRIVRKITTSGDFDINNYKPKDSFKLTIIRNQMENFKAEDFEPNIQGYFFAQIPVQEIKRIINYRELLDSKNIKYEPVSLEKILKLYTFYKLTKNKRNRSAHESERVPRELSPDYLQLKYVSYGDNHGVSERTVAKMIHILVSLDLIVTKRMATLHYKNKSDPTKFKLVGNYTLIVDKTDGWEEELAAAEAHFKKHNQQNYDKTTSINDIENYDTSDMSWLDEV